MTLIKKKPTAQEVAEYKDQVALANRLLHHYGLTTYLGHASARIPETDVVVIKGRPHTSMDRLQAKDMMLVDRDGQVLEAGADYPTRVSEWPLHGEVYKARSDVGCVIHTHQKWCTILGIVGKPVLPLQHPQDAAIAAEPWPVYQESYAIITEALHARVVARLLGQGKAIHLRTHGMLFAGPNPERTLLYAIRAEHQAWLTWHALAVGVTPETLPIFFMRDELERGVGPTRWEAREGARMEEWANFQWMDGHPDAIAHEHGLQF